jgi:GNAT superfamily N-acetyltransferase
MPVIHLVRNCRNVERTRVSPAVCIQPMGTPDRGGVVGLTAPLQPLPTAPIPTAPGLMAELSGRPNREVEAWVAVPSSSGNAIVLGLAALVTSSGSTGLRKSVAWLLVHPSARRRGIGRSLVETLCHEVSSRDQPEIWVECHTKWEIAMAFWRSMGFQERAGASAGHHRR